MKTTSKSKPASKAYKRLPSIHPGRILRKEVLEERGITQTQPAHATGLPVSRALGTSVNLWFNLQRACDLEEAQRTNGPQYNRMALLAAA